MLNGKTDIEKYQDLQNRLKAIESRHMKLEIQLESLQNRNRELIEEAKKEHNLQHILDDNQLLDLLREKITQEKRKIKNIIHESEVKINAYEQEILSFEESLNIDSI